MCTKTRIRTRIIAATLLVMAVILAPSVAHAQEQPYDPKPDWSIGSSTGARSGDSVLSYVCTGHANPPFLSWDGTQDGVGYDAYQGCVGQGEQSLCIQLMGLDYYGAAHAITQTQCQYAVQTHLYVGRWVSCSNVHYTRVFVRYAAAGYPVGGPVITRNGDSDSASGLC